jgi:YD repeat-containing protein
VNQTAYNANNQLTTWGTANFFYDTNGNMTSDGTHSYTWDARNRLTQIDSGNTGSFAYDPFGRRTSKTILSTQTGFLYDRANPVQELSGTTVTANSLSGGVDEVFQRTDSAGARSFLTDALGSTLALTDSSGMLQTQYTFEPFGKHDNDRDGKNKQLRLYRPRTRRHGPLLLPCQILRCVQWQVYQRRSDWLQRRHQ